MIARMLRALINIQSESESKCAIVHSPTADSNPELYRLIKDAVAAFENSGNKDFFEKHPTYL